MDTPQNTSSKPNSDKKIFESGLLKFLFGSLLGFITMTSANAQKSYIPATITGLPASLSPSTARILSADFDGDNDKDLLYQNSNISGFGIHYARNNGNSTFTIIDANNTGLFAAGPFMGITFSYITDPDRSVTGQIRGQRVLDYDVDGDQDILEISTTGSARILLLNAGVYTVGVLSAAFPSSLNNSVSRWVIGDFDSDGDQDVLYQSGNTPTAGINFLNNNGGGSWTSISVNGSGQFVAGPLSGITFTRIGNTIDMNHIVFDADGDGDKDLYELTPSGNRYFTRNAGAFSPAALPTGLLTSLLPSLARLLPGDYDHDTDIDFLFQTANASGTNIGFLQNNRNGTFTQSNATGGTFSNAAIPFGPATFTYISRAALNQQQILMDLDGDTDLDIFQLSTTGSSVLTQVGFNLPIKLLAFNVNRKGQQVLVTWKTSEEINVKSFVIEYSKNAQSFTALTEIDSRGSRNATTDYDFLHRTPIKGLQYYRLVEIDLDGSKTYFPIKSILMDGEFKKVQLSSSMIYRTVSAYFTRGEYQKVELLDNLGKILVARNIGNGNSEISISMDSYSSGIYFLRFIGSNSITTERFIKR